MADNHQGYHRINQTFRQLYPQPLTSRQARHLNTLAGMVSGIVRSGKSHFKAMAKKVPDGSKTESRSKRFVRYMQNEQEDAQTYYMPYLEALLVRLARCGAWVSASSWRRLPFLASVVAGIFRHAALNDWSARLTIYWKQA